MPIVWEGLNFTKLVNHKCGEYKYLNLTSKEIIEQFFRFIENY